MRTWPVLLPILAFAPAASVPGGASERPNIVFIFSDDHAWQTVSAYGHSLRLIETPQIDRLAREGMRFDRCLVPNSICGPSRATVLTGQYSHRNGFYRNGRTPFDGSQPTFPKLLRAAGYQTALVGKWHLISDPTGFDYWHILPGQGIYYNPAMNDNGTPVKHAGYVTDIITDLAIRWLRGRDRSRPFLLMCHNKAPHRPWQPALRHLDHDGDRLYPAPETLFDDYGGRGPAERDQDMTIARTLNDIDLKFTSPPDLDDAQRAVWDRHYAPRNDAFRRSGLDGRDLILWKYRRYLHDYLGCIRAVDENVGRLLDCIDAEGLASGTIVVYASDQGFYMGEHGWFDKRWIYEESLRTPFLVRWPGHTPPGSACGRIVSNLDFAQTFLDAAGVPAPAQMQGRSLVPLLRGGSPADWRTSFYYHYYEYPGAHSVRRHYGIVTDRYKLFHFYEPDVDCWELIDLENDPREMRSVYAEPACADVRARLHRDLTQLRAELGVPAIDPPPEPPAPGKGKGKGKGKNKGKSGGATAAGRGVAW